MKNQKIKIRKIIYRADGLEIHNTCYHSDHYDYACEKCQGKKFWDIRPPEQVNNYIRIKKMAEEINRIQYRVYMSDEAILKLYE